MVETVQPSTSTQPNVAHMTEVEQYVANIMFLQNGQKSTLLVRGTSVENVHKNLVKENTKDGIIQIKVEGIKAISSVLKGIEKKKWSVDELINFTNRYTSLLKVKLAPQDILENMYREGGEPVLLQLLYVCVGKSKFLDEAMETMPGVFPKDYCGIIKASRSLADMYGIMKEISLLLSIKKKIYGNITNIRNALLIPVVAISGIMFATSLYVTPLMIQMYD